jgi:hypothetical protein
VGFLLGQRLSPALTDALMSIRRLGVETQRTDRPDNGTDNVDKPMDGPGQVHGSYSGRVLRHSMFTRLVGRRIRPGEAVAAALRSLRRTPGQPSRPEPVTSARQAAT